MIEDKVLTDLGLSEIESKAYLAALELGDATVLDISKTSGVKRSTCYVALDNLLSRGFVSKSEKETTTTYSAEEPGLLLNQYKEKIANFEELLPFFQAKQSKANKPRIKVYEGKDVLDNIYRNYFIKENSEWLYFFGTNAEKAVKIWPNFFEVWIKRQPSFKETKEIVNNDKVGLAYAKKWGGKNSIKIMPSELEVFSDIVISKHAMFIVSLDNLFGVLIESEDLAKTFKNFFLLAWKAAEEV